MSLGCGVRASLMLLFFANTIKSTSHNLTHVIVKSAMKANLYTEYKEEPTEQAKVYEIF